MIEGRPEIIPAHHCYLRAVISCNGKTIKSCSNQHIENKVIYVDREMLNSLLYPLKNSSGFIDAKAKPVRKPANEEEIRKVLNSLLSIPEYAFWGRDKLDKEVRLRLRPLTMDTKKFRDIYREFTPPS